MKKEERRRKSADEQFAWVLREHVRALLARMTRAQIALVLHINKSQLYKWESGQVEPSWLSRQATIKILESLRETCLGVREV